ncbi:MAG: TIGR04076 family protein [Planctomycetota bacterium]|jgi:uncharacterized repeat protein (TIGR04076 family)
MGPCSVFHDGQVIHVDESLRMPEGFCETAWKNFYHNIRTLGYGGNLPFFEETNVAINSCTDGMIIQEYCEVGIKSSITWYNVLSPNSSD